MQSISVFNNCHLILVGPGQSRLLTDVQSDRVECLRSVSLSLSLARLIFCPKASNWCKTGSTLFNCSLVDSVLGNSFSGITSVSLLTLVRSHLMWQMSTEVVGSAEHQILISYLTVVYFTPNCCYYWMSIPEVR